MTELATADLAESTALPIEPSGPSSPFWLRALRVTVIAGAIVLAVMVLAASFPTSWWRLWLLQHVRPQIGLASLVVVPMVVALRCYRTALAVAAPLLFNLAVVLPLFVGGANGEPALSVTHINVDRNKTAAIEYANRYGSDIVFLQEVQPEIESQFEVMSKYRLVESNPEPDTRGSAMLVRKDWDGKILTSEVFQLHDYYRPFIAATIEVDGERLTLLSFHAIRPFAQQTIEAHGGEIKNLADWVAVQEYPVVVVGDFNATPWSSAVQPLKDQGLVVSMTGLGYQPTWPSSMPALLRIPIDICLHSPEWVTISRSVGENVGSDHLPVHLEFAPAES